MESRVVAIIPARYDSTRFPGKPLADIAGKPMIQHVYERAAAAGLDRVIVATDDARIGDAVRAFGGEVAMTSAAHPTGTDRIAEVAATLADAEDIIVNVQGDVPFLATEMIVAALAPLRDEAGLPMATIKTAIHDPADLANPNVVKVVTDRDGYALYFSRHPIPYRRDAAAGPPPYKHIGLYAYRQDFLLTFARLAPTPLERAERLEQLRALEWGYRIRVGEVTAASIEIDTPEDLERARAWAAAGGTARGGARANRGRSGDRRAGTWQ